MSQAAIKRVLADIAAEERDSGGPDDGNACHRFSTRISDVKAILAMLPKRKPKPRPQPEGDYEDDGWQDLAQTEER